MGRPLPIAVFASGFGSNLQAILNAVKQRRLRARVVLVHSDRAGAVALARARRAGVETLPLDPKSFKSRREYESRLLQELSRRGVRLVALAGYMRILSPFFVRRFRGWILNIHPALLPAFPGARAIHDALEHGAKVTGVTVHLVDEGIDTGPIVLQEAVAIREGEAAASLEKRIHRVEHQLYPKAIQFALDGRLRIAGRRVRVR